MEDKPGINKNSGSNKTPATRFRLSIRTKLFALLIIPFFIPLIGYSFIKNQELALRESEQSLLADYARVAATVLSRYKEDFDFSSRHDSGPIQTTAYASPISYTPLLDGYFDDWPSHIKPAITFNSKVKIFLTTDNKSYFIFIKVSDDEINYFNPENPDNHEQPINNEQISISSNDNKFVIYTSAPGKIFARKIIDNKILTEPRINGSWVESDGGYSVELKAPKSFFDNQLALSITDSNSMQSGSNNVTTFGTNTNYLIASPSAEIQKALADFSRKGLRFWVSDLNGNVLASTGSIKEGIVREDESFMTTIRKAIYRLVLQQPTTNFKDDRFGSVKLENISNLNALQGNPFQHRYATPDNRAMIMSAAHPIYANTWPVNAGTASINAESKVIGAITIEKNSNKILLLHNKAMESIIDISILAFIITLAILLFLTTHISRKIIRLRDHTQSSISSDGRIIGAIPLTNTTRDEISDLNDSFHSMIERVSQYNDYLENMAGRLSHELKTPLAIVSSSLDNMSLCEIPEDVAIYHKRAVDGINRLRQILSAMSEATRLEHSLDSTTSEQINLTEIVNSYCQGFQSCFNNIELQTNFPQSPITISGNKDLIAQMLDKLLANAVDFHTPDSPISVKITFNNGTATLAVSNYGKTIPDNEIKQIFSPMVSLRPKAAQENNLGLGLYIAQLISKFHKGHIYAKNLDDKNGVMICIDFLPYDSKA